MGTHNKTVTVIGLGKLGLPLACILAKHYNVIGIDSKPKHIRRLDSGENPIDERGLDKWFDWYHTDIQFTTNYALLEGVTFVVVPTPSLHDHRFTSRYVEEVLGNIHISTTVAIVSTLMPGETDRLQELYPHLNLVYNPTFIALGSVIRNFLKPNFILLGTHDADNVKGLAAIYNNVCYYPKYQVMTPLEAEIAKLTLNCYITTKITFANQIGNLCHQVGVDPTNILEVVGMDKRVGKKCFKAGLGYGGPCFPRDNQAMTRYMLDNQVNPKLSDTIHILNSLQVEETLNRIRKLHPESVGFKSLSYKKGTHHEEQSQLRMIHDILLDKGYNVIDGKGGEINLDWDGITKKEG